MYIGMEVVTKELQLIEYLLLKSSGWLFGEHKSDKEATAVKIDEPLPLPDSSPR